MRHSFRPPTAEVTRTLITLLCWLALLLSTRSMAADAIVVAETGQLDHVLEAANLEVYTGEGAEPATIEAIDQLWQEGAFKPAAALNFGLRDNAIWGRMVIDNRQSNYRALVLSHRFAPTDLIEVYFQGPDGEWIHERAGDIIPFSTIRSARTPTFLLNLPPEATVPVYVRIATASNLNFLLRLQYPSIYNESELRLSILYGTLFGAVLISAFYLALWGVMIQNMKATILGGYLLFYAVFLTSLMGFARLVMPETLIPATNHLHVLSLALMAHMGMRFYRNFFQLERYSPHVDKLAGILQWLSLSVVLTFLIPRWASVMLNGIVLFIGPAITIGLALQLWRRKIPQAGFFTLGWIFAQGTLGVATFRVIGFLSHFNWPLYLPALGLVLGMAFFSAALLKRYSEERQLVFRDYLTGLLNRRGLDDSAARELERAQRFDLPLSLVALDVDHFKRVNDEYGHDTGDKVLEALAECLLKNCREQDLVARVGGEEFVILFVQTDLLEARQLAERIRLAVANLHIQDISLTVSVGVAPVEATDTSVWDTLLRADRLLYQAKHQGRNRTVSA